MEWIIWVIVIALIIAIVWWLLNRNNAGNAAPGGRTDQVTPSASADGVRADGALSGGAAASAAATGTWAAPAAEPAAADPAPEPAADGAWAPAATAGVDVDDWEGDSTPDAVPTAAAAGQSGAATASAAPAFSGLSSEDTTVADGSVHGSPADDESSDASLLDAETLGTSTAGAGGSFTADDSFDRGDRDNTEDREAASQERAASILRTEEDRSEWESQWSEAGGTPRSASAAAAGPSTDTAAGTKPPSAAAPAHHQEYTGAHSPTLPGAESAAAENGLGEPDVGEDSGAASESAPAAWPAPLPDADGSAWSGAAVSAAAVDGPASNEALTDDAAAETQERTVSTAASETAASHSAEPMGHLATDQPYGEGSASPAADGTGPEGYTVKGDAGSMTYHDETSGSFEETRAEVWFESIAHAEAAGFRAPRRTRT
ncbi:hypothetical protein V3C33_10870 [Micrococcaceae bacterium Sec5.7]